MPERQGKRRKSEAERCFGRAWSSSAESGAGCGHGERKERQGKTTTLSAALSLTSRVDVDLKKPLVQRGFLAGSGEVAVK